MFSLTIKRLIAKASVAVLLFAQLAVAAYACPAVDGAARVLAAVNAAAMQGAMPGCDMGNGESNPNLCLQHCQAGDQSVQTLAHVAVPAFAAISTLLIIDPLVLEAEPGIKLASAWSAKVPLPPPLFRFGVLRI
jgi:hypothetical protein